MADTQEQAPQPSGLQPITALGGSIAEAQEALLSLLEPEEEKPKEEEAAPTEEEESTEETQDESLEEESEEEAEESEEEEEEESEESDEGEDEEPELYAVTVNGEEREVSFDELLKGYSRQSDYTRKTQELSNDRKQFETLEKQYNDEISQIQTERQQYMEALNQVIENSMGGMEKYANTNWEELKTVDPLEYITKKEEYREAQEKVQAFKRDKEVAQHKQAEEFQKSQASMLQEEHGKLVEALPDWGDTAKQKKLATQLKTYALSAGFSEQELNSLVDHRSVLVLLKASKYDAMQNADIKSKRLKNKPKVVRSGKGKSKHSSDKGKRTAQMKRLRGTGHINDASALLEDFIDI